MKNLRPQFHKLMENWFLLGILFTLILAYRFPNIGNKDSYLYPSITTNIAISIIFFISGLNTPFSVLYSSIKNFKVIIFSLLTSFALFPTLGTVFGVLLMLLKVPTLYAKGFVIATCMPPPASAGVILTSYFKGDESTSLVISVVGNLASIFISPLLIIFIHEDEGVFPFLKLLQHFFPLVLLILVPTVVGQFINMLLLPDLFHRNKMYMSIVGKIALLYIILIKICPAFLPEGAPEFSIAAFIMLLISIISIQLLVAFIIIIFDIQFHITHQQQTRVALVLSSSLKSLTTGIAIISILQPSGDSSNGLLFPLLMFEPIQISFATIIGSYLFRFEEMNTNTLV